MIKAVIFDMFETLITLFTEHTYFGEDAASDAGVDPVLYRKVWHENEKDRTTGKMTIEEGIGETLQKLGVYSDELLKTIVGKRLFALQETFDRIPDESVQLLEELDHNRGRNMFMYSLFRCAPLILQPAIYDGGRYLEPAKNGDEKGLAGVSTDFLNNYMVMKNLDRMTEVTEQGTNTFLMITNARRRRTSGTGLYAAEQSGQYIL